MAKPELLLEAGALVPVKSKVDKTFPVDPVSARQYGHAALGDRPVVKLTADSLAQGDDLAMEFLGFDSPTVAGPVAVRRRQALGFPGWALINDPGHARYALEIVKEFRREIRRAKSKPGHAYDGFVAIADKLGKGVAHFLPSFWEEVGRELITIGNNTYAARAFNKAREAEKVHALPVDENIRKDAFLEFALAGCLTNKALTEYAKELEQSVDPQEAWTFFRELCVRRTKGGMPPWTSMTKELAQLATAAKLDVDDAIHGVMEDILESPAMARAPMGFWKACSKSLKALAAKNDRVAGLLLNLLPQVTNWDKSPAWEWLEFLKQWDVLPNAWADGVSDEAAPSGGPAAWFGKFAKLEVGPPALLFTVLSQMADRLKRDDKAISLDADARHGNTSMDVNLLDLALELDVPVDVPNGEITLAMIVWAQSGDGDSSELLVPRDPVHIHAHSKFKAALARGVADTAGAAEFEAAAQGKEALKDARREWLLGLIDSASSKALPDAKNALDRIESATSRATFQEFPEAHAKLKQVKLGGALQRTLAAGNIDEYGWPDLEAAIDKLNSDKSTLQFFGAAPYVVVTDGLKAIVVGPTGIELEHEIQTPAGHAIQTMAYLDGDLYLAFRKQYRSKAYWASSPKKVLDDARTTPQGVSGAAVPLADGGVFIGTGTIFAGQRDVPRRSVFTSDGQHFWRRTYYSEDASARQIDPVTLKDGRASLPSFYEDYIKDDWELDRWQCSLLPAGDWAKTSPLGWANGLVGWRVRRDKTEANARHTPPKKIEAERIDGKSFALKTEDRPVPCGLLDIPASSSPAVLFGEIGWEWTVGYRTTSCAIWDAAAELQTAEITPVINGYNAGQAVSLPPLFWHVLQARDVKASKKLRSTNKKQVDALLKAAQDDVGDWDGDEKTDIGLDNATAAAKKWLATKSDGLARGIGGIAVHAGKLARRVELLIDSRDPAGEDERDTSIDPETVKAAMRQLGTQPSYSTCEGVIKHVGRVVSFLRGDAKDGAKMPPAPCNWMELLSGIEQRMWKQLWIAEEGETEYLDLLEAMAATEVLDLPGKMRVMVGKFEDGKTPFTERDFEREELPTYAVQEADSRYLVWKANRWNRDYRVLEYTESDNFRALSAFTPDTENSLSFVWSCERLQAFVTAIREHGQPEFTVDVLKAAADQLGASQGEVGLFWSGLPINNYSKNYLPKALRTALGLKVNEADAARTAINALSEDVKKSLVQSLLNGEPTDFWEGGGQVAINRLVEAWKGFASKRLDVPANITKALDDSVGYSSAAPYVEALADPTKHPRLTSKAKWKVDLKNRGEYLLCDVEETFDYSMLKVATMALPLIYSGMPNGSDAGRLAVEARERALKCLKSKDLIFHFGQTHLFEKKTESPAIDFLKSLPGKTKVKDNEGHYDDGMFVGGSQNKSVHLAIRPATLKDDAALKQARNIADVIVGSYTWANARHDICDYIQLLRSPGFQAIADRIKNNDAPANSWEANPLISAPKVVVAVAKKLKLDEDSAVLYLQLLALHDPITANLKTRNDWPAARIKKAATPLLKAELILEAKRARAGRNWFLPGGWEALKAPNLPLETWKLPFFGEAADGSPAFPLSRIVPLQPYGDLFEAAWKRTQSGDAPKYEIMEK